MDIKPQPYYIPEREMYKPECVDTEDDCGEPKLQEPKCPRKQLEFGRDYQINEH